MFIKCQLQFRTLKTKEPLRVLLFRGTPGKSPQPPPTENGVAAAKSLVHTLFILLKSVQFRVEYSFILEEKSSREGFLLLITECIETTCLLHKLTRASRIYRGRSHRGGLGCRASPFLVVRGSV